MVNFFYLSKQCVKENADWILSVLFTKNKSHLISVGRESTNFCRDYGVTVDRVSINMSIKRWSSVDGVSIEMLQLSVDQLYSSHPPSYSSG